MDRMSLTPECSRCGETVPVGETHDCPAKGVVEAADGCPMCGAEYDSWLDHLRYDH